MCVKCSVVTVEEYFRNAVLCLWPCPVVQDSIFYLYFYAIPHLENRDVLSMGFCAVISTAQKVGWGGDILQMRNRGKKNVKHGSAC